MKMRHPNIDRLIDVPESTARALQGSGWTPVDEPLEAIDGDENDTSDERSEDSD